MICVGFTAVTYELFQSFSNERNLKTSLPSAILIKFQHIWYNVSTDEPKNVQVFPSAQRGDTFLPNNLWFT